jgi:flagellar biosynthesis/type III secretory pathway chaperone
VQNPRPISSESLGTALVRLVTAEIDLSERLLALVGRENVLMEQPLATAAQDLLRDKLTLLQELQAASTQRQELMQSHGFSSTAGGVVECSAACPHTPGLTSAFARLAQLARECHEANQRLGLMLNRKASFFARLLGSMADSDQSPLYQANGHCDPGNVTLRQRFSV